MYASFFQVGPSAQVWVGEAISCSFNKGEAERASLEGGSHPTKVAGLSNQIFKI